MCKILYALILVLNILSLKAQYVEVEYSTKLLYSEGFKSTYSGILFITDKNNSYFELDRRGEYSSRSIQYPEYIHKDFASKKTRLISFTNYNPKNKNTKQTEDLQYTEVIDTLDFIKWDLTHVTKDILGYKCQKAIGVYKDIYFTAWFTMDIPIMDGPWRFCDLPGLILEVISEDEEIHIKAEKIIKNPQKRKDPIPSYEAFRSKKWDEHLREAEALLLKQKENGIKMGRNNILIGDFRYFDSKVSVN